MKLVNNKKNNSTTPVNSVKAIRLFANEIMAPFAKKTFSSNSKAVNCISLQAVKARIALANGMLKILVRKIEPAKIKLILRKTVLLFWRFTFDKDL